MADRTSHLRGQTVWVVITDVSCLALGILVGVAWRMGPHSLTEYIYEHADGWLVFCASIITGNYLAGAYGMRNTFSKFNLVIEWLFSLVFALALVGVTSFAWFEMLLGRGVLALTVGIYSALTLLFKLVAFRYLFRSRMFICRTAILGDGARARHIRRMLENEFILPAHHVVAYVRVAGVSDDRSSGPETLLDGVPVIAGTLETVEDIMRSLGVNLIVLGFDRGEQQKSLYPHLRRLRFEGIEVLSAMAVSEIYTGRVPIDLVDEAAMMDLTLESGLPDARRMKRVTDIAVSIVLGAVCVPIAAFIAALIKLGDPRSPVIYVQKRVGLFGRVFSMYKFRSMKPDAEDLSGPVWATRDDSRPTAIGRVLRRFRLDEIPQLLNVLRGEMSFVGPRPERPELVTELEKKIPFFNERANVMPGITGWAQTKHPYGGSVEDAARKLEYDLYYIKNISFGFDLQIILHTIRIVLLGKERTA